MLIEIIIPRNIQMLRDVLTYTELGANEGTHFQQRGTHAKSLSHNAPSSLVVEVWTLNHRLTIDHFNTPQYQAFVGGCPSSMSARIPLLQELKAHGNWCNQE